MDWCCVGMESHIKNPCDIGFTIIIYQDDQFLVRSVIQSRSINIDDFKKNIFDVHISAINEIEINYCPWCGVQIEKWYKNHISEISRKDLLISSVFSKT